MKGAISIPYYNLLNNYNLKNNLDEEFDRILRDNYDK